MRRALGLLVVVLLAVPALSAAAGSSSGEYKDDFNPVGYSGNDGSLEWSSPWYEIGDDGTPTGGSIHIGDENCAGNKCLHIEGGLAGSAYVKRLADLGVFETADLCFDLEVDDALLAGASTLSVQISTDEEGTEWATLAVYPVVLLNGRAIHETFSLNQYLGAEAYVRFLLTEVGGLETFSISIDNVEIKGEFEQTTTTSSTTTTITLPTTTITLPTTTTSTQATTTTTTTSSESTTTTTTQPSTSSTTTTTVPSTTTTEVTAVPVPIDPPAESGLRDPGTGLMADFSTGMSGDMGMGEVEVLGAEVTANFSMAVEAFEVARVWIVVLVLMVTVAIVSGMDMRRSRRQKV